MATIEYTDLKAHDDLMDMLQQVIDKANALLDASQTSSDLISEHNTDVSAHEDIRQAIVQVENKITEAAGSATLPDNVIYYEEM